MNSSLIPVGSLNSYESQSTRGVLQRESNRLKLLLT
jgi:hypothetical protein